MCAFEVDGCVRRWLDGLSPRSVRSHLPLLLKFFGFCGVSAVEAVEFQRVNALSYRFVDAVYEWFNGQNLGAGTKRFRASMVRGFFLANRVPLPKDKHRFRSEKAKVVGELTVDEFRKIVVSCNLTYKAAFLIQFQSGSGVGELLYINESLAPHVWDEVRKGQKIIRLVMPGRKQNRNVHPYYSFIGTDAVDALRQLFHSRGWKQDSVLFRTLRDDPVSANSLQTYFRSQAVKLGLIKSETPKCLKCGAETVKQRFRKNGANKTHYLCTSCHCSLPSSEYGISQNMWGGVRYRMRTHELRDLFRTEFHRAQTYNGADSACGEFFMGHSIDKLKYDKIMRDKTYALEQYRRAMPFLNVLSEDPRKVERAEVDSELTFLRKKVSELEMGRQEFRELERKVSLLLERSPEWKKRVQE